MRPYRRRRFREDEEEDSYGSAHIAAVLAAIRPPNQLAPRNDGEEAAATGVAAAAAAGGSSNDGWSPVASVPSPAAASTGPRDEPSPQQVTHTAISHDASRDVDAESLSTPSSDPPAAAAAAAAAAEDTDAEGSTPSDAASSSPAAAMVPAPRSVRRPRLSLEGTGVDARGRKATVAVFVQRWSSVQVEEAFDRLRELLYPDFVPATVDAEELDDSLTLLLDEWNAVLDRSTRTVLLEDVSARGSSGRYQMARVDSRTPLVVGAEQMREMVQLPFEMPKALELGADEAQKSVEEAGAGDGEGEGEDVATALGGVEASKERAQLQSAVRPFLEQLLSLHQVTLPDSPLRARLREVLSVLVAVSYGYEMQLFACCLESFQCMPSASLSPGILQRLVAHVLWFVFTFRAQMDDTSREALRTFLLQCLRSHISSLTPALRLSMLEAALIHQLEDACSEMSSQLLLPHVLKHVPSKLLAWCACGRGGPATAAAAAAGSNGVAIPAAAAVAAPTSRRTRVSISSLPAACVLCQRQAEDAEATAAAQMGTLSFRRMLESVTQCKAVHGDLNKFFRSQCGASLSGAVVTLSTLFCPPTTASLGSAVRAAAPHMLCNLLLLGCKWAQGAHRADSPSLSLLRQEHGLTLVLSVLQSCGGFFFSSPPLLRLIRSVLPPTLLSCCTGSFTSTREPIYRLSLRIFSHLYETALPYLGAEIGLMLLHAFMPLLEAEWATMRMKQHMLETMRHLFRTPLDVMRMFHNFDYHLSGSNVMERLFATLMHLLEGDVESLPLYGSAHRGADGERRRNGDTETAGPGPGVDEPEVTEATLAQTALRLLVHLLFMQAQWIGVPGLKRAGEVPPPMQDRQVHKEEWHAVLQQHRREQQVDQQVDQLARAGKIKAALRYQSQVKVCSSSLDQMAQYLMETEGLDASDVGDYLASLDDDFLPSSSFDSLRGLYVSQLDFQNLGFDEALRVFLCEGGFRLPGEAQKIDRMLEAFCKQYVKDNPGVFRNASSAFIVCFALVMLNTDLHDPRLRSGKSKRTPMSLSQFVSNLRGVDDGRDFPPEFLGRMYRAIQARGIEWKEPVLASSNDKKKKRNVSAAQREAEAVEAATRSARQMQRRVERKLKHALLAQHSWSSPTAAWLVAPLYDLSWFRALGTISILADQTRIEGCLNLCLDGLAYGTTIAIVLGARTTCNAYLAVLAKLTFVEQARSEHRVQRLFDEIHRRQALAASAPLSSSPIPIPIPLPAALASLAPATSSPSSAASPPTSPSVPSPLPPLLSASESARAFQVDVDRRVSAREHLRQGWYQRLAPQFDEVERACRAVFNVCTQTKQQLNKERRFVRVQQLQEGFGDAVSLYCPGRELLKEGVLWRFKSVEALQAAVVGDALSANSSSASSDLASLARPCHFMLFTDLLVYATSSSGSGSGSSGDGSQARLKWKHAFHLSLLRAETNAEGAELDAPSLFPFTLASPQANAPLLLAAADSGSRAAWITMIDAQRTLLRQRQSACTLLRDLPRSQRISRFVGAPLSLELDPDLLVVPPSHHCRLCLRAYNALFRRSTQCQWCAAHVCTACCQRRMRMPPHMLALCAVQPEQHDSAVHPPPALPDSGTATPSASLSPTHRSSLSGASAMLLAKLNQAASSMHSHAAASVSSMHLRLRSALARLNEREGVPVCDACSEGVQRDMDRQRDKQHEDEDENDEEEEEEEEQEEIAP